MGILLNSLEKYQILINNILALMIFDREYHFLDIVIPAADFL